VTERAEIDNFDVDDFHTQIPNPAKVFPFELDTFQKRGILRME
jgi:antiviral helicase SKI2